MGRRKRKIVSRTELAINPPPSLQTELTNEVSAYEKECIGKYTNLLKAIFPTDYEGSDEVAIKQIKLGEIEQYEVLAREIYLWAACRYRETNIEEQEFDKEFDGHITIPSFLFANTNMRSRFISHIIKNRPLNKKDKCTYDCAYIKLHSDLNEIENILIKADLTAGNYKKMLGDIIAMKKGQLENNRQTRISLYNMEKRFDESNIWGLKPLRKYFQCPYFKSENGNTTMSINSIESFHSKQQSLLFKPTIQKWTYKDVRALQQSIKESIIDIRINENKSICADAYYKCNLDLISIHDKMKNDQSYQIPEVEDVKPVLKRRGRPPKDKNVYHGSANILLFRLQNGIEARVQKEPKEIETWEIQKQKEIKKMTVEALVNSVGEEKINWTDVSNRIIAKTKKNRSEINCFLAWKHEAATNVSKRRWNQFENNRLMEFYDSYDEENQDIDRWNWVGNLIVGRTPSQCFYRYQAKFAPKEKFRMNWTRDLEESIIELVQNTKGNWTLTALICENSNATRKQIQERWKKNLNPILKHGSFSRLEDALLMLTVQRLKPILSREGHFGSIMAYLPWRFETTWRDRAENLFSDWIVPWTIQEDRQLLKYGREMARNWSLIASKFANSFKNRKGCLTRYKILTNQVGPKKKYKNLEEYHEMYSMTRYNVIQYKHLHEIAQVLICAYNKDQMEFEGFDRNHSPTEHELFHFLLSFNKIIVKAAIRDLKVYIQGRQEAWKDWLDKYQKRKKTFDRRTFRPDDPQSVASAIHIRGVQLMPEEKIKGITEFQKEVYFYFKRFQRTKQLKKDLERPYIPTAKGLREFEPIKNIVTRAQRKKK